MLTRAFIKDTNLFSNMDILDYHKNAYFPYEKNEARHTDKLVSFNAHD